MPTSFGDHIGLAVVRSLGKNKIPTAFVSKDKNALPFYSKYCSEKIVTDYDDHFLSGLTQDDIIMPNGEEDMLFFAKNSQYYDYELAYPDISLLETIINKHNLMQFAKRHNIPIPKTLFVSDSFHLDEISNYLEFPIIIKPIQENSGRGVVRVDSPDMVEEIYEYTKHLYGPPIIQEFIPFKKRYSAAAIINKDNEVQRICIINMNRIYPLDRGPGCFVKTAHNTQIMDLTFDILKSLKIWGVVEFEYVIDERDGRPKLMEINPRFWSSVQCAISAGVDFPFLLHQMVTGNDIPVSYDYKAGVSGRYLFPKDLLNLLSVLRGNFSYAYKIKTCTDFMKFYEDDAYYIFSLADMGPFFSVINNYRSKFINRKLNLPVMNNVK